MKLTKNEQARVLKDRETAAAKASRLKECEHIVDTFITSLSDAQMLDLGDQIGKEYRRLTQDPGHCTCDQQWTNPNCPRIKAGWGGMNCDEPPSPVYTFRVQL